MGCDSEGIYHPFWELYNTGLLGVVLEKPDGLGWYQRFRQPDDMTHADPTEFRKVQYYLIHPALTPLISKYPVTAPFDVAQFVIVGYDYPWE